MNQPPRILQIVLLALVAAGVGVWAWRGFGPQQAGTEEPAAAKAGAAAAAATTPEPAHCVWVTYFTTDQRCPTCIKIEKQTREAVETGFANELASGEVRFRTLNLDHAENAHFAKDYGLAFKSVVISDRHHGKEAKWEKFDKVWDLVGEPEAFAAYLQEGLRKYLTAAPDA